MRKKRCEKDLFNKKLDKFSIRKFTTGTFSVAIGSLLMFGTTQAQAAELNTPTSESAIEAQVPIPVVEPTPEEAPVVAPVAEVQESTVVESAPISEVVSDPTVTKEADATELTAEILPNETPSLDNAADQIETTETPEPLDAPIDTIASRNAIEPIMATNALTTEESPTTTTSEIVSFEPDPESTLKPDVHLVTSNVSEDLGQVIEFGKRHTGNAEITVDKGSIYLDTKLRFSTDFVAGRELAIATNALGESAVKIANAERIIYELNLGALTSFRQTTIPFFFAHEVKENLGEPTLTSDVLIEVLDKNGTTIQRSIESFTSHREIPVFVEIQNKLHDDLRNETATNKWGVTTDPTTNEKNYITGVIDKEGNILERSPISLQWLVANENVQGANTWAEGQRDIEITLDNPNFTVTNPIRKEIINKNQPLNNDFYQTSLLNYNGNSTEKERVTVTINLLDSLTGEIKDTVQIPIVGNMIVESTTRDILLSQTIQFTDQIPNLQRQSYPNNINPTKIEAYPGDEERIDIQGTANVRGKNDTSQQVTLINEFTYTVGTEAGNHFMISQLRFDPNTYGSRVSNIELYDVNKQLVQILPFANDLTVTPGVHSVRVVFKEGQDLDVTNGTSKQLLTYTGSLSQDYTYEEITGTGVLSNRLDVKFLYMYLNPE